MTEHGTISRLMPAASGSGVRLLCFDDHEPVIIDAGFGLRQLRDALPDGLKGKRIAFLVDDFNVMLAFEPDEEASE